MVPTPVQTEERTGPGLTSTAVLTSSLSIKMHSILRSSTQIRMIWFLTHLFHQLFRAD